MIVLIKLFYAGAITSLLILFVAFGIRTVYAPPKAPVYPGFPRAYVPPPPTLPGEPPPALTPEQIEAQDAQRRYQAFTAYEDDRAAYHRNVFLAAALLGVLAVAGGVAMQSHLDALRLGLVSGGLGTVIYGVLQAAGDLDNAGASVIFAVAAFGLLLVGASGYRWLSAREQSKA